MNFYFLKEKTQIVSLYLNFLISLKEKTCRKKSIHFHVCFGVQVCVSVCVYLCVTGRTGRTSSLVVMSSQSGLLHMGRRRVGRGCCLLSVKVGVCVFASVGRRGCCAGRS